MTEDELIDILTNGTISYIDVVNYPGFVEIFEDVLLKWSNEDSKLSTPLNIKERKYFNQIDYVKKMTDSDKVLKVCDVFYCYKNGRRFEIPLIEVERDMKLNQLLK